MKVYLVTHGKRSFGFNPWLTATGIKQIAFIRENLLPKIPRPPLVVVGTGTRFEETYIALAPALDGIPP